MPKTEQLQIRLTPEQKRILKRLARETGMDVSRFVLERVLPADQDRFQLLASRLRDPENRGYALADLADWLGTLPKERFSHAVARAPKTRLDPEVLNYLAAALELAADRRGVPAPEWVQEVAVPAAPLFGSALWSVRLHLLTRSPVAFRRRNIFVDSSIDQRV